MSTGDVVAITVEAVWLVIKCSAPMLITSLVVGLIDICTKDDLCILVTYYLWRLDPE